MEIRLNKNDSKYSVNEEGLINISLSSKYRVTPFSSLDEVMDLSEIYNEERDNSGKYRIVFTINPICSNILFNMRTEIIRNEGTNEPKVLIGDEYIDSEYVGAQNISKIDNKQAIRDTEYSHEKLGNFTYHCGADIFNNHMLRTNDFIHINRIKEESNVFNTINDFMRDENGDIIEEYIGNENSYSNGSKKVKLHIYRVDNITDMYTAFQNGLSEVNGWVGFTNKSFIDIPIKNIHNENELLYINRVLNNKKPCEFIDMYPDRSLYSFIPKINKYKQRLEYNWDYLIMYPYYSDYDKFNEINSNGGTNAIKITSTSISHTNSGIEMLSFRSLIKSNLKKGDYVRLYYVIGKKITPNKKNVIRYHKKISVNRVGDVEGKYTDKIFNVKLSDLTIINKLIKEDGVDINDIQFFYKKEIDNYECKYYLRRFRELRNGDNRLRGDINKLAYGENIYGDRIAQLLFSDIINIENVNDNLGRPLHEIYLTFLKTNRGRKEWYTDNFTDYNIEYSHCFGKLTSGFDLGFHYNENNLPISEKNYNVRKLHNINLDSIDNDYKEVTEKIFTNFKEKPLPLEGNNEDGIVLTNDVMELYGDIVELSKTTCVETTLEDVYYRFNTEQRETSNKKYYDIITDRMESDDYDIENDNLTGFSVKENFLNIVNIDGNDKKYAGNLQPEGYIYKAHNKIVLRELSDDIKSADGYLINHNGVNVDIKTNVLVDGSEYDEVRFTAPIDYGFEKGNIISFYDNETSEIVWGTLDKFVGTMLMVITEKGSIDKSKLRSSKYTISLCKDKCPTYASYIPLTQKYVWRDILSISETSNESELYNMPFTNGCHYLHKTINFFLQRQDPIGNYYMFNPEDDHENKPEIVNPLSSYRRYGWSTIDFSSAEYLEENIDNTCF